MSIATEPSGDPAALLRALDAHLQAMPPVAALRLRIAGYDGARLALHAPLAANVNDKGCAFGGSLASLMTLAGWGLATLQLQAHGLEAAVYVADSQVRYLAPLHADLDASAWLAEGDWDAVRAALRADGRASVVLQSQVAGADGTVAATGRARYVAFARPPGATGYDAPMNPTTRPAFRAFLLLCATLALAALAGCATTRRVDRNEALREAQYAWSAAIRWGDFEGAWTLVDPKYREAHPITSFDMERYQQVEVSAYHELGSTVGPDTATRPIEIGVVNRHTQLARTARYFEQWRYDADADRWWVTSGLPDLWQD